jgi:1-acyl-sn-glycerol-3-phosphate acyltransferase
MLILYNIGKGLCRLITRLIFRIRVRGRDHIPRQGGFILALNHVSYYDPPVGGSWSPRVVYFMAKAELFKNRLFAAVLRDVNALPVKRGTIDRDAVTRCLQVIESGYGLVVFPEGTRSKTGKLLEGKPGIGLLARKAGCAVVPGHLHGFDRLKECFTGQVRMSVIYGKPIPAAWISSQIDDKEGYREITRRIMEEIATLREAVTGLK